MKGTNGSAINSFVSYNPLNNCGPILMEAGPAYNVGIGRPRIRRSSRMTFSPMAAASLSCEKLRGQLPWA